MRFLNCGTAAALVLAVFSASSVTHFVVNEMACSANRSADPRTQKCSQQRLGNVISVGFVVHIRVVSFLIIFVAAVAVADRLFIVCYRCVFLAFIAFLLSLVCFLTVLVAAVAVILSSSLLSSCFSLNYYAVCSQS